MQITDKDIINAARQLRDEGNEKLYVKPWNRRRRHPHVPSWLIAVPAAAFIGFVLGYWAKSDVQNDHSLANLTDTVYVKVNEGVARVDTPVVELPSKSIPAANRPSRQVIRQHLPSTGKSVSEDKIRYDLLVRN